MLMLALKHIICSMLCCKFQKINNKQTFQNILYILLLENHATSPLNYESKYFLSVGGSNTTLLKLSLECNYRVNCMQSRLQTNSSQISSLWDLIHNIIILFKTLSWIRCNDMHARNIFQYWLTIYCGTCHGSDSKIFYQCPCDTLRWFTKNY